jgi:hypothetical protein
MRLHWNSLLAVLVLCLAGCDGRRPAHGGSDEDDPNPEHIGEPLTEQECQDFAVQFEKAVNSGDDVQVNNLIDMAALFEKSLIDLGLSKDDRRLFQRRAGYGPNQRGGFGKFVANQIDQGGSYKLLRIHKVNDEPRARYRVLSPDGSVDYHDLILGRRTEGDVKCLDIDQFRAGEPYSRTAHRLIIPDFVQEDPKLKDRLPGAARPFVDFEVELQTIALRIRQDDPADALNLYDKLPQGLQEEKSTLLLRLRAAQRVGGEPYRAAVDKLRARYPDEPFIDLHAIDYYLRNKDHAKALEMVANVDKAVGGDPFTDVVRARVYADAGDLAAERRAGLKAIEGEPTLQPAYWVLVGASLREKKFDETLARLQEIERRFAPKLADFSTVPEYAEFVKSPQYQEWLKSHPVKKP